MLQGTPVFGIPGNPVAAMLMVEAYVRPALRKLMGYRHLFRPERQGILNEPWRKGGPDGRVHFLRAVVREVDGEFHATLTGPQGAGILSSMLRANALVVIAEEETAIPAGGSVRLHLTEASEDH
jgi:molybdopterin molybdotransferase